MQESEANSIQMFRIRYAANMYHLAPKQRDTERWRSTTREHDVAQIRPLLCVKLVEEGVENQTNPLPSNRWGYRYADGSAEA